MYLLFSHGKKIYNYLFMVIATTSNKSTTSQRRKFFFIIFATNKKKNNGNNFLYIKEKCLDPRILVHQLPLVLLLLLDTNTHEIMTLNASVIIDLLLLLLLLLFPSLQPMSWVFLPHLSLNIFFSVPSVASCWVTYTQRLEQQT